MGKQRENYELKKFTLIGKKAFRKFYGGKMTLKKQNKTKPVKLVKKKMLVSKLKFVNL